jgi:hypothetical protein
VYSEIKDERKEKVAAMEERQGAVKEAKIRA